MLVTEYIDSHIQTLTNKSADEYARRFNKYVRPSIGRLKMTTVRRDHIIRMHKSIDAKIEANMVVRITSAMFSQAELDEVIPRGTNPCYRIPMNKETKRKEFMSKDQINTFLDALNAEQLKHRVFFTILLYTGARESEIRTAKWSDIDGNILWLADSKTGSKEIYLPDIVVDPQSTWRRIRVRAGMPWLRMHDLRRTFASVAMSNGVSLDQVGRLLGHKSTQTTHRYAYLAGDTASKNVNLIAEAING
jgi:integrase